MRGVAVVVLVLTLPLVLAGCLDELAELAEEAEQAASENCGETGDQIAGFVLPVQDHYRFDVPVGTVLLVFGGEIEPVVTADASLEAVGPTGDLVWGIFTELGGSSVTDDGEIQLPVPGEYVLRLYGFPAARFSFGWYASGCFLDADAQ